jgi:hypothetical protein
MATSSRPPPRSRRDRSPAPGLRRPGGDEQLDPEVPCAPRDSPRVAGRARSSIRGPHGLLPRRPGEARSHRSCGAAWREILTAIGPPSSRAASAASSSLAITRLSGTGSPAVRRSSLASISSTHPSSAPASLR